MITQIVKNTEKNKTRFSQKINKNTSKHLMLQEENNFARCRILDFVLRGNTN